MQNNLQFQQPKVPKINRDNLLDGQCGKISIQEAVELLGRNRKILKKILDISPKGGLIITRSVEGEHTLHFRDCGTGLPKNVRGLFPGQQPLTRLSEFEQYKTRVEKDLDAAVNGSNGDNRQAPPWIRAGKMSREFKINKKLPTSLRRSIRRQVNGHQFFRGQHSVKINPKSSPYSFKKDIHGLKISKP